MCKVIENVLGYCDNCGETSNKLVVIEAEDAIEMIGLCLDCKDELILKLTENRK